MAKASQPIPTRQDMAKLNKLLMDTRNEVKASNRQLAKLQRTYASYEKKFATLFKMATTLISTAGDRRDEIKREIRAFKESFMERPDGGIGKVSSSQRIYEEGGRQLKYQR
jgi:hypothetical protein